MRTGLSKALVVLATVASVTHGDTWMFVQKQTDSEERRRLRDADSATVSRTDRRHK
jgi:hypothetical protein